MKRLISASLALVLLLLALPIIGVLALLTFILDGVRPFYISPRVGKGNRNFLLIKLATLQPDVPPNHIADHTKDRPLRIGSWLRDRGWDELPELLHVIQGNMTFIGPRSLHKNTIKQIKRERPQALKQIETWEEARSGTLPGLTGWQQVHTDGVTFNAISYDMEYLANPSFIKKLQIIGFSIIILLTGKRRFFSIEKRPLL